MLSRYLGVVKERKGFSWYESEVHPRIVSDVIHRLVYGRSYELSVRDYKEWLDRTGMDMIYGYLPWQYGRVNQADEWGRFVFQTHDAKVGDYIPSAPLDKLNKRINEILSIQGCRGVEWALYNTPQIAMDALGFEEFSYAMMDKPEKLLDWMKFIDDEVTIQLHAILKWPINVVQLSQYAADKNGPLFNPECMEKFCWGFTRDKLMMIHFHRRLASIHTDGNCQKLYKKFRMMGVDIVNGYDDTNLARDYKENMIRGAIPCLMMERGKPEEIKECVKKNIQTLGPHVICSAHDVKGEVPTENFLALQEAALDAIRTA